MIHCSFPIFQVEDLEQRLNSSKNQIQQLSHTLSDREAQFNIETNTVTVSLTIIIINIKTLFQEATHLTTRQPSMRASTNSYLKLT